MSDLRADNAADRPKVTVRKTPFRGADGRTRSARRMRDLYRSLLAELPDTPTESQKGVARRIATLMAACEAAEAKQASGVPIDMAAYAATAGTIKRLTADLRRPVPRRPSLRALMASPAPTGAR